MIGFTYERVNYSKDCVNTYSLRGIWRRREGDKRHADNEFTVSPPLSPVGLARPLLSKQIKEDMSFIFFFFLLHTLGGGRRAEGCVGGETGAGQPIKLMNNF